MASFVLALAGTAVAQDNPTQDAYGGVLGNEVTSNDDAAAENGTVQAENDTAAAAPVATAESSLPFTGFEVGLVALAGIGLVMLGVAMRRSSRRSES